MNCSSQISDISQNASCYDGNYKPSVLLAVESEEGDEERQPDALLDLALYSTTHLSCTLASLGTRFFPRENSLPFQIEEDNVYGWFEMARKVLLIPAMLNLGDPHIQELLQGGTLVPFYEMIGEGETHEHGDDTRDLKEDQKRSHSTTTHHWYSNFSSKALKMKNEIIVEGFEDKIKKLEDSLKEKDSL
ncbi:hypothetical protein ACJX0J_040521 [Zea mays]